MTPNDVVIRYTANDHFELVNAQPLEHSLGSELILTVNNL